MADKNLNNAVVNDTEGAKSSVAVGYSIASSAYTPELSQKCWDDQKRWDSTKSGRLGIRMFSRGVLGAAGFALGGWYAGAGGGMKGYYEGITLKEIGGLEKKLLPSVAKFIDETAGKPIKFLAKKAGSKDADGWVKFRPTKNGGQSLGQEAVGITTDFFCASIGDALGRDIADCLDPNVKHKWQDTKGHIEPLKALEEAGKSVFRYFTYNGGEDWAVAVPYALYMRFQRNFIDKHFSKGFGYDSDRSLNGGSFKVNGAGNVTGNYNLAGALDLQGRFTAYNIGTLMYREAYNHVGHLLNGKDSSLYGSIEERKENHKEQGVFGKIGDLCKWAVRSVIKGTIIMTPAVPFFSMFRTPQTSYKGIFINPETNEAIGYRTVDGKDNMFHANSLYSSTGNLKNIDSKGLSFRGLNNGEWSVSSSIANPLGDEIGNYKASYNSEITGSKPIRNLIGGVQNGIRHYGSRLPFRSDAFSDFAKTHNISNRDVGRAINASMAYTPYMFAKAEAARYVDHGKTDAALERMIDGACDFNFKEFKAGAGEVVSAIRHKPFADPIREAYAEKRVLQDTSPADQMTKEQEVDLQKHFAKKHHLVAKNNELSWQERVISGRPSEKEPKEQFVKTENHIDQEAMRKALQELQPPTNSIH